MASDNIFTDEIKVSINSEQLSSNIGDEAIILDLKSSSYYGLNPVGTYIWQLIQEPKTVGDVKTAILAEFDVDIETCSRDLQKILTEFANKGLIKVVHEQAT